MKKTAVIIAAVVVITQLLMGQSTYETEIVQPPQPFNPLNWNWNFIMVAITILLLVGVLLRVFQIQKIIKK